MINQENDSISNKQGPDLLGDFLKQKRLEKNFSLEKLSQKTKISVNILKSLEANDFENLPSPAYIKGFVTNYAKVVGIPQDEAINKMEFTYLNLLGKPFPALNHTKMMPSRTEKAAPAPGSSASASSTSSASPATGPTPQEVIKSGDSLVENTKSILPIAIFAGVILLFIGGYKLISSVVEGEMNKPGPVDYGPRIEKSSALLKNPEVKKPESAPAEPETTAASPDVPETKVEPSTPPAQETPVAETKPEETSSAIQRNFPPLTFKRIKSPLFSIKTDAPENNDSELLPERVRSAMNPQLQNVYIRATDGNTWLSYKIDNQPIESAIISKGNDLFLQGNEIRVFLGNVNVTKIFYNNYLITTPTKTGVKSLIFPPESNSKFMMPLFPKANDDIQYTAEEYMKRMKLEEEELGKQENR